MKQNVLILFALCLISLLFTGCSQNNASHENHISSDILDLNSSEITSSENAKSESSSEENNQSEASTESTPPENHQQIIESSESWQKSPYLKILSFPHPTHRASHLLNTTNRWKKHHLWKKRHR